MKKLLLIIIIFLFVFFVGCKKDEEPQEKEDEEIIKTAEPVIATHEYDLDNDEVNPYIVIKGLPSDDAIDYSIIAFLNFPKNFNGKVLTKRYYNYLQCDYYTDNDLTTYYHTFDHADDDGGHLSNAFNFCPRYHTSNLLTKVCMELRYEYELDAIHQDKTVKFEENILRFEDIKISEIIEDNDICDIIVKKNDEEDFYRYKISIKLDEINNGHYDIQTWLEVDDKIIPFIGYYHYRTLNGDINSVSDEKISIDRTVSSVYYMLRFYDSNGNITEYYYQKRLD